MLIREEISCAIENFDNVVISTHTAKEVENVLRSEGWHPYRKTITNNAEVVQYCYGRGDKYLLHLTNDKRIKTCLLKAEVVKWRQ